MNEKLDMQTPNWANINTQKLAELFPNCVTETAEGLKVDFDLLKQELSTDIIDGTKERYRLEWPGKREAIVTANLPTNKTLRPIIEDSVDFDNTENLYIEGDNLEVLKLLQESYLGKIKMIYIDPPYNTGNDFIYKDNFAKDANEELNNSGQKDEYNQRLIVNPITNGRYHSDWLTMIYPRLKLARTLLDKNGFIMISIGADELNNLISICNEVFGESNKVSILVRQAKTGGNTGKYFSPNVEYIVVYSRESASLEPFKTRMSDDLKEKVYNKVETNGIRKGEFYRTMGLYQASLKDLRPNQKYFIECPDGTMVLPPCEIQDEIMRPGDGRWRWTKEKLLSEIEKGNVIFTKSNSEVLIDSAGHPSPWNIYTKIWLSDREEEGQVPNDLILKYENRHSSKELKSLDIPFDFAKPVGLIKYLLEISQLKDEIILDFFSGSGTTANAVLEYNSEFKTKLKYIQIQLPEELELNSQAEKLGYKNICEIGKERIRRAAKKIKAEKLENAKKDGMFADFNDTQDYGFRVYRLDESNMQDVYYKPQDYQQANLDLFADNIKADRTPEDLLAQVMLDWGLPLSLKIERKTIAGKTVFAVAQNSLYACFDTNIDEAFAKELAKDKPLRIVFRDKGFKDDTAKENVKQLLKQLSAGTEMRVL